MTDYLNLPTAETQLRIASALESSSQSSKIIEAYAVDAQKKATEALEKSNSTQYQLDQVVIAGDSSVEAAQAHVDNKGVTHLTLKARIDNFQSSTEEQINSLEDYSNAKLVNIGVPADIKPIISFIDDDGAKEVYSRLLPIMQSKNVGFGAAIITSLIGANSAYMTLTQLQDAHSKGLETLSHCHDVTTNLTDGYTETQIHQQMATSKEWLKNNGFEYEGFVYPQSAYNRSIKRIMRQHYNYAFGNMGINDKGYLEHNTINRIAFGAFTDGNPTINGNSEKNTLAYYKACVDYAITTKSWLIFMLHVSPQPVGYDAMLGELIDYIKSLNVEILKPSQAFKIKANKFNVGDAEENHIFIGESNYHMNIGDYQIVKLSNDRVGNGTSSDFFGNDKLTYCLINVNTTNFPEQRPGVLITDKIVKDRQYAIQSYRVYKTGNTYERMINSDGSYGIWRSVKTNVKLDNNTVSSSTPITTFPKSAISYCLINNGDTGFPDGSAGILETNTLIEDYGYCKQIFRKSNNRGVYERVSLTAATYSEWVLVSNEVVSRKATVLVPEIVIPANSIVDTTVNFAGLKRATSWVNAIPSYGFGNGIMCLTHLLTDDTFTIRVQNTTASQVTVSARSWVLAYII